MLIEVISKDNVIAEVEVLTEVKIKLPVVWRMVTWRPVTGCVMLMTTGAFINKLSYNRIYTG